MSDKNEDLQRIEKHCEDLGEHFDTVQIFCTRLADDGEKGTVNIHFGRGNWFARYGFVAYWMKKQDELAAVDVRRDEENQ
jgi:hypothetical protein